jgi:hypothetical protein
VAGRQRRRRMQLLDDRKGKKGYWKLKDTSLFKGLWICPKTDYEMKERMNE